MGFYLYQKINKENIPLKIKFKLILSAIFVSLLSSCEESSLQKNLKIVDQLKGKWSIKEIKLSSFVTKNDSLIIPSTDSYIQFDDWKKGVANVIYSLVIPERIATAYVVDGNELFFNQSINIVPSVTIIDLNGRHTILEITPKKLMLDGVATLRKSSSSGLQHWRIVLILEK